ncbi:MAG: hypothetical protein PVS3B3_03580 [Ktedonobacteraceae bacterium]
MRLKNIDLIVTLAVVASNVLWVSLPMHSTAIGIILALPLVFLLPGYIVTEVLSYKRPLNATYRIMLSIGLSISIDILGGFILNMFAVGLRAKSWVVLLGLVTGACSFMVAYLRRHFPMNQRRMPAVHIRIHEYVLVGFAIIVIVLSIQYSATGVTQQPHAGFTQLWMLPPKTTKGCTARLGVRSFEPTSTRYQIKVRENGVQVETWTSIVLAPQEEWNRVLLLPPQYSTSIDVLLYRADKPEQVYREVHMVINNTNGKCLSTEPPQPQ